MKNTRQKHPPSRNRRHLPTRARPHPEKRGRILTVAKKIFFAQGFYKVTMDELALGLRMSKRTLYEQFSSKDEILRALVRTQMAMVKERFTRIMNTEDDVITILNRVTLLMGELTISMNPVFFKDLSAHAPDLWEEIDLFRSRYVLIHFEEIFRRAQKCGMIRKDINVHLFYLLFITAIQTLVHPERLQKTSIGASEVFEFIIKIMLYGAATDKGRALINPTQTGTIE